MYLLVTGAYPKKDFYAKEEGFKYEKAFLSIIDWKSGKAIRELTYKSPKNHRNEDASMMFKAGEIYGKKLIVPTSTEILFINLSTFEIEEVKSLPSFTDLHHLSLRDDKVYIANTGLELVQIIDGERKIIKEYSVSSKCMRERFGGDIDFRFVKSTKPHECHVNHVFFIGDELWCTRLQKKDAISLHDPDRVIDLNVSNGGPHDGLVKGEFIYFTLTDGYVAVINRNTLAKEDVINLNDISGKNVQLGWCRGVEIVDDNLFIGFSSLRRSRFSEFGQWIRKKKKKLPARIARYDIKNKTLMEEVEIGDKGAAIFTVRGISESTFSRAKLF